MSVHSPVKLSLTDCSYLSLHIKFHINNQIIVNIKIETTRTLVNHVYTNKYSYIIGINWWLISYGTFVGVPKSNNDFNKH